jgi:SpoIID/LytB domain protein
MAQIHGKKPEGQKIVTDQEINTWYDREAHTLYDVCADDHCQRYQGITKTYNPNVEKAVEATRGMFLMYNGEVCDARFSKCCGGRSETFENCWQPVHYDYLESVECPYCNTNDEALLRTILNDYDRQSKDFYRWTAKLNRKTLPELLKTKTGIDFGEITDLQPLERGESGRITRLAIIGTKRSKIFGKEVEIRRILSQTHLYSSAFEVEKTDGGDFVLHGEGWGHGVGMCQIGAAVMASKGFKYDEILRYYYKNVMIEKKY